MKFRSIKTKHRGGARSLAAVSALCGLAAVTTLGLLLIASCSSPGASRPNPATAAETYLAALKVGDYQAAYRMLAEHDLVHGSLDEFLRAVPMAPAVDRRWFRQIEGATYYLVKAPVVTGKEAVVPVNVTTPNLVLWERMLGARCNGKKEIVATAERQLYEGRYPTLNYPDQIVLVMEAGGEWHVLAGYAQRQRIARIHDQAIAAYHEYQFDRAVSLYRQIMERLERAPFTGSGGLIVRFGREMKAIQRAKSRQEQAQAYISKLALKDVTVQPTQSGAQGLFGKVTNTGDMALNQVDLTVSYYNLTGKVVFVEKHTPIAIPLEFTDFDMPIVPFKPGQTLDFGFVLHASPQIQRQAKPRVAVGALIFSEFSGVPPKLAGAEAGGYRQALPAPPQRADAKPSAPPASGKSGAKSDAKHGSDRRGP